METVKISKSKFHLSDKLGERVVFIICLICMFLFLYTAYSKFIDHQRFFKGLSTVSVIGSFAIYLSWLVPSSEVLVSVLLIIPRTYKLGLYGFAGLVSVFTIYIISMVLWAKTLPCNCGGVIEKLTWVQHIWFNLAFIAIAVFALYLSNSNNFKIQKS
ncbi:MauE/DoxX family redox-associated membrane protein [Mucilaginibacter sp. L196]|uniref:MauE/DoxX family redox-associated membrane protein n=1 Tax=Mucilaginibacter sp. L196 TaxID=1641870 RepID=UPI00131B287F|nr:MauE/DoxX family redox-associated membrane protein [Mucilaginibacter sp. L196]